MASSVSVGGSGVYVSDPVLGDQVVPSPVPVPEPLPGTVIFADPDTTAPQAWVVGSDGTYVAVGGNTEGEFAVVRTNATGDDQTQYVGAPADAVHVDPTGQEGWVVLPNGTYVAAGLNTEGGFAVVRTNATGDDQAQYVGTGSADNVHVDPTGQEGWVVLPDGKYVAAGVNSEDGFVVARTNATGDDQAQYVAVPDVHVDPAGQEGWVVLPNGTYVAGGVNTEGGFVVARTNATGDDQTQYVAVPEVHADPAGQEGWVVLPNGTYVAAGVNTEGGFVVARTNASGDEQAQYVPIPSGAPGGFPPSGGGLPIPDNLPGPGDLPVTLPGSSASSSFLAGTGADTVVAPGAVATAINPEMGSTSLVGAGALSHVDTFFGGTGGGLVNLGADSVASSQLAGAFVQDQALNTLVAPAITDSHAATPSTGSVLSLDDGLTTIQLQGIDHKHS